MKSRICIISHFGFGKEMLDGQTVKTKVIAEELERHYGKHEVRKIDTYGGFKRALSIFFNCLKYFYGSRNIVMLPAHNGVLVFTPMLYLFNCVFKRRLHYVVIGGWLPEYLKEHKITAVILKRYYKIYVETPVMMKQLITEGFLNIELMYNCKKLNIVEISELECEYKEPYKFCTFSRVTKGKGIEDAINAVIKINATFGRIVCELDIYGQVEENYRDRFEKLQRNFPGYIKYMRLVDFGKSTQVLKKYYALLFPTHFRTEGIPGTIIDALAAGIPTVAHTWDSADVMIEQKATGIIYPCDEAKNLEEAIIWMIGCNDNIFDYKRASIIKAKEFIPQNALKPLMKNLV